MKDKKHIQSFNEHQENLNISDSKPNGKVTEIGQGKREKIFLNGYEMWLDREKLMLYDKEDSQHGIGFDVAGEGDGIYIFSQHLTKDEKRQLTDYMKYGR
jgi:hypothetical protein